MKLYIFCIAHCFLLLTIIGCKKDNTTIIIPPDDDNPPCIICDTIPSKLEVLWQQPLHPDTFQGISTKPVIANGKSIFTRWPDYPTDPEIIIAFDGQTGEKVWEKESLSTSHTNTDNSLLNYGDNILYKASGKDICLMNSQTGENVWCYNPNQDGLNGDNQLNIIDNHYYRGHYQGANNNRTSYLVKGDLETGNVVTIFSKGMEDGFTPQLTPPKIWNNQQGENILFFKNQRYNWNNNKVQTDVFMYNANSNELEYEWKDVTWSSANLYIFDDKIYSPGNDTMFCLDIISKEIIWKEYIGQNAFSNFFVEKNVLIVNPDGRTLMGLNPHTGEILWQETDSGSTCSNMIYHNGIVYFSSLGRGLLYAVNIETGEHLWAEKSPNKGVYANANFGLGVTIDEEKGYLYTTDAYFVMAIKLPER